MKRLLFLCAMLAALTGCGQTEEPHTATLFAMDTVMELTVYGDEQVLDEAEALITDMERRLSVTDSGSEIAALNRTGGGEVSADTRRLLERALGLCELTGGAPDITVYPVVKAWGFTTGEYRVPDEQELSALLELADHRDIGLEGDTITLAPGMEMDLGGFVCDGAGKGCGLLAEKWRVRGCPYHRGGHCRYRGPEGQLHHAGKL